MSVNTVAHLVFGIDFGSKTPERFSNDLAFRNWLDGDNSSAVECVYYHSGFKLILGVPKHLFTSEDGPTEVRGLEADEQAVEMFKQALRSIGIENPEPEWLLVYNVSFQ